MSKIFLFLILCTCAFASVPKDVKQQKRSVIGNDGWIGLTSPYGHGHPWSIDHNPWKGLKLSEVNLHTRLAGTTYGSGGIALTPGIVKTVPVYITKHVIQEKPVPIPEPVIIEKPYHVPLPIEKIIHKPVPVPIPVPQTVPIPVDRPVPIPVKQPIAVPVQQPYPVPVKHPVPVPVPIPVPLQPLPLSPLSLHPPSSLPLPLHHLPLLSPSSIPLIPSNLAGAIYARDYVPDHLHVHPAAVHLDPAPVPLAHGLDYGLDHVLAHGYSHGYDAHAEHLVHGHDHKKRKTDKN